MAHVFISYSHKDTEYAHRLADELKRRGIEVWIDDRIEYGTVWTRALQENLERSQAMILIMSSNAYNSDPVQDEVAFAQRLRKPILPLRLDDTDWLLGASTQYADVRGGKMPPEAYFEKVNEYVRRSEVTAQSKVERQLPQVSAEELRLRTLIFYHLKEAIESEQRRTWQIGLFKVDLVRGSQQESYSLSCEVSNENLLRQYDSQTYAEYTANVAILNKNKDKLQQQGASLKTMLNVYTAPLVDLLRRLSLNAGNVWMHKPTAAELQRAAEQLIHVHKVHHIPIDAIKVQVLNT